MDGARSVLGDDGVSVGRVTGARSGIQAKVVMKIKPSAPSAANLFDLKYFSICKSAEKFFFDAMKIQESGLDRIWDSSSPPRNREECNGVAKKLRCEWNARDSACAYLVPSTMPVGRLPVRSLSESCSNATDRL